MTLQARENFGFSHGFSRFQRCALRIMPLARPMAKREKQDVLVLKDCARYARQASHIFFEKVRLEHVRHTGVRTAH